MAAADRAGWARERVPGAAGIGMRMLGEVEETSLEEVMTLLRTNLAAQRNDGRNEHDEAIANAPVATSGRKIFPIPALDGLVGRHFRATQSAPLAISGQHLPLLYTLIATLIVPPQNKAVVVIDVDGRFDPTRLLETTPFAESAEVAVAAIATGGSVGAPVGISAANDNLRVLQPIHQVPDEQTEGMPSVENSSTVGTSPPPRKVVLSDLNHVHIYRSARSSKSHVGDVVAAAESHMLYGTHASRAREWWGTIVIGGGDATGTGISNASAPTAGYLGRTGGGLVDVAVTSGWKGWLRVDRAEIGGFGTGVSVEEALVQRERRHEAFERAEWHANSVWGGFAFGGGQ